MGAPKEPGPRQTEGCFPRWPLPRAGPGPCPTGPRLQVSPRAQTGQSLTRRAAPASSVLPAELEPAPRGPSCCSPARGQTRGPPLPRAGSTTGMAGSPQGGHCPPRMDTGQWGKGWSTAAVNRRGRGQGGPGEVENRSGGARGGEGRGARTGRSAWQRSDAGSVLGGSWGCWGSSVGERGEAARAPSSAQNQGPPSLGLEETDRARSSRGRAPGPRPSLLAIARPWLPQTRCAQQRPAQGGAGCLTGQSRRRGGGAELEGGTS